ncbi:PHP domain-containing protein [Candidatus Woesearchaeota archaeon]|nr:PHP domain-containing protein [Candidatus Woesearchaeota archaeon]MBW3021765.1 PHP domain-containing protein [Candidatus Woesearchaeota archaeon]
MKEITLDESVGAAWEAMRAWVNSKIPYNPFKELLKEVKSYWTRSRFSRKSKFYRMLTHLHTDFSYDARGSIKDVLDNSIATDTDVVAVTDHENDDFYMTLKIDPPEDVMADYHLECKGDPLITLTHKKSGKQVHVIRAMECLVTDDPGLENAEVITIGHKSDIKPKASLGELITQAKEQGAISVAAHPFFYKAMDRVMLTKALYLGIDGVEAFHAPQVRCLNYGNRTMKAFLREWRWKQFKKPFRYIQAINRTRQKYGLAGVKRFITLYKRLKKSDLYVRPYKSIMQFSADDSHNSDNLDTFNLAGILIPKNKIDFSSGESFMQTFREVMQKRKYKQYRKYYPLTTFLKDLACQVLKPVHEYVTS